MKYFIFLLSVLMVTSVANAGWVEAGKVVKVHSGHAEDVMYFTTETQHQVNGCNNSTYTYAGSDKHGDRILSILLAAYLSQKPVAIYLTGACLQAQPEVNAVQMKEIGVPY